MRRITCLSAVLMLGVAATAGAQSVERVAVDSAIGSGVTFAANASTFTLAPGASQTIGVSVTGTKKTADGHKQATLRVSSGGAEVAHALLYALVGEGDAAPGQHMVPVPKVV